MRTIFLPVLVTFLGLLTWTGIGRAQSTSNSVPVKKEAKPTPPAQPSLLTKIRSPLRRDVPLTEKLRSPRETLRTFLFAVNIYDVFPEMMEDALASLDLDFWKMSKEEGTFLALELEKIFGHLE